MSEGWMSVLLLMRISADRFERTKHELCFEEELIYR